MFQCCCVGQLSCQPVRVQVMSQPANAAGWRQGRLLSPIVVQRGGRNHLLLQLGLRLVLSGRGVDIDLCSKGGLGRTVLSGFARLRIVNLLWFACDRSWVFF